MKKVFITGGAGFIGANLVKKLVETENFYITIYDNFSRNSIKFFWNDKFDKLVKVIRGDIMDFNLLKESIFSDNYNYVFHLAAIAGVDTVMKNPILTFKTNLLGSINLIDILFEYFKKFGNLERIILFSTSEVFGEYAINYDDFKPLFGGKIGEVRWNYAISKLAEEHFALTYYELYNLPVIIVRPFNIYGDGQVGDSAIKTFIINSLLEKEIYIHGDGSQVRSWCYIDDMVNALIAIIKTEESIGKIFNIGNPYSVISIYELATKVVKLINSKSKIIFSNKNYTDVYFRIPSIDLAKKVLNFFPQVSLDNGILKTADFYKKNMHYFLSNI
jgi:dTDP-glucose 4,6-dehydratase